MSDKIIAIRELNGLDAAMVRANEHAKTHDVKAIHINGTVVTLVMQEARDVKTDNKSRSTRSKATSTTKSAKPVRTVRSKSDTKGSKAGESKADVPGVS